MTTLIEQLCASMDAQEVSDLFLSTDRHPAVRTAGKVLERNELPVLQRKDFQDFITQAFSPDTWTELLEEKDLDRGLTLPNAGRFRVNLSIQRGNPALSIRRIPSGALDFHALGIPEAVIHLADQPHGLILVTGPTGSGKSTTLAAILHYLNQTVRKHIVTIEDPVEFAHEDIKSVISQREIGSDTKDFHTALKFVLRQNPDAIFIGEIRDSETVQTAISAALTGHLVAATLHTSDVRQTVEQMINLMPEAIRDQVALNLSNVLLGIVSQRLLPHAHENKLVPAFEFLKVTPTVQKLIRSRELDDLDEIIRAGSQEGMVSFNRSLFNLYNDKLISLETARESSPDPEAFVLLTQGMETGIETFRNYSALPEQGISIKKLLRDAVSYQASDLILTADMPPCIILDGDIRPFDMPKLTPADTRKLLFSILTHSQRAEFEQKREIDFALAIHQGNQMEHPDHRFRVNGFYQKGAVAAAIRLISNVIPSPQELGLPQVMLDLCNKKQGLVLITGPTGSGKSTTLAAMIDRINQTRACHIITIEDPIEFVHQHHYSLIEQREVNADTLSFNNALKYILRQAPDIILVGEMRDPETIASTLTAAETGHLVFATLHTNDVTQSVDRIIDVFPADRQNQVRTQLAACLEAVVSQRLLKRADQPKGRVAAFEILTATTAVRSMIRERKTHQLLGTMEASAKDGMITMERAMKNLLQAGKISPQDYAASVRSFSTTALPF